MVRVQSQGPKTRCSGLRPRLQGPQLHPWESWLEPAGPLPGPHRPGLELSVPLSKLEVSSCRQLACSGSVREHGLLVPKCLLVTSYGSPGSFSEVVLPFPRLVLEGQPPRSGKLDHSASIDLNPKSLLSLHQGFQALGWDSGVQMSYLSLIPGSE